MPAPERVLVMFHLGLGDMLVSNALIRHMCSRHRDVVTVVKKAYMRNGLALWADVENLSVYPLADGEVVPFEIFQALGFACLVLGDNGISQWHKSLDWTRDLYAQAGVPSNIIRRGFVIRRDKAREQALYDRIVAGHDGPYMFVHDDPSRNYTIDPRRLPALKTVHPGLLEDEDPSTCLFDYCKIIECAQEVHVMDSCFAWLVELAGLHDNIFMHCEVKSGEDACRAVFRGPWKFVRQA